jgi:hypothetical protein
MRVVVERTLDVHLTAGAVDAGAVVFKYVYNIW